MLTNLLVTHSSHQGPSLLLSLTWIIVTSSQLTPIVFEFLNRKNEQGFLERQEEKEEKCEQVALFSIPMNNHCAVVYSEDRNPESTE